MTDASATIRSVRVRLDADVAGYIRDMTLAGKATEQAFGSSRLRTMDTDLRSMSRSSDQAGSSLSRLSTDMRAVDQQATRTSSSLRRNSADIDRYSGRLGIMVSAIAAIGPAAIPITASTIPAIAGLTGGVGALVAALGTGVLAIHGVGDALKALDAYQLNPTEDNLQKLRQAMDALPASGRELVRTLDRLEPSLQRLQRAAAQGFLPDADKGLRELMVLFPQVRRFIGGMSDELGRLTMEGSHSLVHDPAWQAFFAMVRSEGVPVMDAWAHATGNVAKGLASLLVDFSGEIGRFDSGLEASSRRFAAWAAGLNQTQGFKDFLDYIHQEGPQVRDFLTALVQSLLAVLRAMAPWGSAVLPILTDVLHLLTAIAGSKAGPVLFDMAAGMLLFTRTAKGLSGLGIEGLTTSWSAGFKELAAQVKVATASMEEMGPAAASAQVFARRGLAGTALGSGVAKNLLGIGGVVGLGSVVGGSHGPGYNVGIGALSGAALGTAIDPGVGTAIGAAAGAAVGLAKSLISSDQATKQQLADWSNLATTINSDTGRITAATRQQVADTLRTSGSLAIGQQAGFSADQLGQSVLGNNPKMYDQVIAQIKDKIATLQSYTKGSGGLFDSRGIQQNISDLQTLEKNLEAGRAAIANTTKAWRQDQAVLNGAATSLKEYDAALQRHTAAANSAFSAETAWRQALKNAEAQAKTNSAGIKGNSTAALGNRDALAQLAAAWNNQSTAVKNNVARFHEARAAFIDTAKAMGVPEAEAKRLAARLLAIPKQVVTKMYADTSGARAEIASFKALLDSIHDKTVTVHYAGISSGPGHGPAYNLAAGSADGSFVPKDGLPYGDRYPYLLAPGEAVTSNRHGQADNARRTLTLINAGQLTDTMLGLADGGWVDTKNLRKIWKRHPRRKQPLFSHEGPDEYQRALLHNEAFATSASGENRPWQTGLTKRQERRFERWVNRNHVPFDVGARLVDYDMRGYWLKTKGKGWHEGSHFPDTFKTPFDTTFSHESKYAAHHNPFYWVGNRLVDLRNGQVVFAGNGSKVPDAPGPYRDMFPYLLAPRERVISNRHGQADNADRTLTLINSGRLNDRMLGLADGGTAGHHTIRSSGGYGWVLRDSDNGPIGNLTKALDDLTNKQLRHLGTVIDDLSKHRLQRLNTAISKVDSMASSAYDTAKSKRSAYQGTISQGLMPDLFASDANSGSVFSRGNVSTLANPAQVNATLKKTRSNAQEFTRLVRILRSRGLSGGALAEIIGDGDIEKARMYAALPPSALHTYSSLYTSTQHAVAQAAAAGGNALVPNVGQLHADLLAVKDAVHEVQHAISANETRAHQSRQEAARTAHHHTVQTVKDQAAKGARDRR